MVDLESRLRCAWRDVKRKASLVLGSALLLGAVSCSNDSDKPTGVVTSFPVWHDLPNVVLENDPPDSTLILPDVSSRVSFDGPKQFSVASAPDEYALFFRSDSLFIKDVDEYFGSSDITLKCNDTPATFNLKVKSRGYRLIRSQQFSTGVAPKPFYLQLAGDFIFVWAWSSLGYSEYVIDKDDFQVVKEDDGFVWGVASNGDDIVEVIERLTFNVYDAKTFAFVKSFQSISNTTHIAMAGDLLVHRTGSNEVELLDIHSEERIYGRTFSNPEGTTSLVTDDMAVWHNYLFVYANDPSTGDENYVIKVGLTAMPALQYSSVGYFSHLDDIFSVSDDKMVVLDPPDARLYDSTNLENYRTFPGEPFCGVVPGSDFFAKRIIDPDSQEAYAVGVYRWDTLEDWCTISLESEGLPYANYGRLAFEGNVLYVLRNHGPFFEAGVFHIDMYEMIEK